MKLNAIEVGTKVVRDIDWTECPVFISEKYIATVNKENSPLLYRNTLVRVDEETGYAEGDIVIDKVSGNLIGRLVYSKGFKMQDLEGNLKELIELQHIKVKRGSSASRQLISQSKHRDYLLFKAGNVEFGLDSILLEKGGCLILTSEKYSYRSADISDIKFMTGYGSLAFGEFYNGGIIVLHNGQPSLKRGNEYVHLEDA